MKSLTASTSPSCTLIATTSTAVLFLRCSNSNAFPSIPMGAARLGPPPEASPVSSSPSLAPRSVSISFSSRFRTKSTGCAAIFSDLLHATRNGTRLLRIAGSASSACRRSATSPRFAAKSTASRTKTTPRARLACASIFARSRGCPGRSTTRARFVVVAALPLFVFFPRASSTVTLASLTSIDVTVPSVEALPLSAMSSDVFPAPHAPARRTASPLPGLDVAADAAAVSPAVFPKRNRPNSALTAIVTRSASKHVKSA
mmetsp:Transcript_11926/g.42995  ORF Transcript_11926/g.42995 Transcript_11926/m.42995 type:complete len:258 (+) Transcript_11926:106-879(+)